MISTKYVRDKDVNIWFTSDIHFGHKNIIQYTRRQDVVNNIHDMDQWIIDKWNSQVDYNDIVFHLGDLTLIEDYNRVETEYLSHLNGNLILIPGNHDSWLYDYFKNVVDRGSYPRENRVIQIDDKIKRFVSKKIHLFHFPLEVWYGSHRGTWHLHGHCHGNRDKYNTDILRLDVGWDASIDGNTPNHRLLSFEEICNHFWNKEKVVLRYHHER